MEQPYQAITSTSTQLSLHPSIRELFCCIVMGVIQSRSVQHQRIAAHLDDKHDIAIRTQRIYRFFADTELNYGEIALLIYALLQQQGKPFRLILDRTNWKFGKSNINFLVLAIRVEGLGAVPLLWMNLDKAGNSNTIERIDLLDRFFEVFPDAVIESLIGDREFVGDHWISYLLSKNVTFYLRVKENRIIEDNGKRTHIRDYFAHLTSKCKPIKIETEFRDGDFFVDLYLVGTRSKEGELVIIMTNRDVNPKKVMEIYKTRWDIECLFGNVKQKGFNMEDTHMTIPERLDKLMAICAVATALCLMTGAIKNHFKPIKMKRTVGSPLYSIFQYGVNHIRSNFNSLLKIFKNGVGEIKTLFFNQLQNFQFKAIKSEG